MKKYLFLLALFIIYLILIFRNDSVPTLSYQNRYDDNVSRVTIEFENGINSNNLKTLFYKYTKDYFIYNVKVNNEYISLSCTNIDSCLKGIYDEQSISFNIIYITNGFNVKELELLAYTGEILEFLNENNLTYRLN